MPGITNLTKKQTPNLPWKEAKQKILGKKYDLSIVLAEDKLMKSLNKTHRKKNEIASTLSFPLSENEGEIFLSINQKPEKLLALLIHSLLHLKGMKHDSAMSKKEEKYLKEFKNLL